MFCYDVFAAESHTHTLEIIQVSIYRSMQHQIQRLTRHVSELVRLWRSESILHLWTTGSFISYR